jgi:hypothetical protein
MDWVQILTAAEALVLVVSVIGRCYEAEFPEIKRLFIFMLFVLIPFARVLGVL